jgi:hypothetical protein
MKKIGSDQLAESGFFLFLDASIQAFLHDQLDAFVEDVSQAVLAESAAAHQPVASGFDLGFHLGRGRGTMW